MPFEFARIHDRSQEYKLLAQLDQYQRRQHEIDKQVSSGKRTGPLSYFTISNWLGVDVHGIDVAGDNIADALDLLGTADAGIRAIKSLLDQARDLALQAKDGTLTPEQRQNLYTEIQSMLQTVNEISKQTQFNSMPVLNGRTVDLAIGPYPYRGDSYSIQLPKVNLQTLGLSSGSPTPQPNPSPCPTPQPQPNPSPCPNPQPQPNPSPCPTPQPTPTPWPYPYSWQYPLPWNTPHEFYTHFQNYHLNPWGMTGRARLHGSHCGNHTQSSSTPAAQNASPCSAQAAEATISPRPTSCACSSQSGHTQPPQATSTTTCQGTSPTTPPPQNPSPTSCSPDAILARLDNALSIVKRFLFQLDTHKKVLGEHQKLLQERKARTESMRSRFEDANYADLEMETSRLDFLRQAALASLTRSQTNQQALIAAFLGFSGQ